MYRAALRSAPRPLVGGLRTTAVRAAPRRFASTASPSEKARTWKGSAVRLGLAFAAVYYYNTSPVFADQTAAETISAPAAFSKDDLPTVDSVIEEKRKQIRAQPEKPAEKPVEKAPADSKDAEAQSVAAAGSPAALEEEAGQQGAFNPETGEINWDCPCLGGMADGPCGEEFKTAFSCFVYSTEEPKGMDCIEKFQGMQECFKKYPDIYGSELRDDDDDDAEGAPSADAAPAATPAVEAQKVEAETPVVEADSAVGVLAELAAEETPAPKPVEESPVEKKDVKEPEPEPKKVEAEVEEKKVEEKKAEEQQPAEKKAE